MASDVFGILGTVQAGAFRVDAVVAEGGFAVVYRAFHQLFRADVALKCLKVPGKLSPASKEVFLERFRAEAEVLFRLSASIPAVVRPLQIGTLETEPPLFVPFIALEWLEGSTLASLVEQRTQRGEPPMTLRAVVELLSPVAHALERAHHFPGPDGPQSVLHRDLKPDNIFAARVHGERLVKVLDFGIAKVKRAATQIVGRQSVMDAGPSAFTPAYAAPEQWLPKRYGQTGPWTDVWGLALTVVEATCGRPPLEGDATSIMGLALNEILRPTPRMLGARSSDACEAVFTKALAVDPKQRFASVTEFWCALERVAGVEATRPVERAARHESLPPAAIEAAERTFGVSSAPGAEPILRAGPDPYPADPGRAAPTMVSARCDEWNPPRLVHAAESARDDGLDRLAPTVIEQRSTARGGYDETTVPALRELEGVGILPVPSLAVPRQELQRERTERALRDSRRPRGAWAGLWRGLILLALAAALTGLDWIYTSRVGEGFAVGPVRSLWLAGPLTIIGVAMIVYSVFMAD
ncbi:MAG: serine/threonine protein kinase [Polyangiaceae bacterium]|nr:serine/threonine protein kinase [Polyangiaceae bacterium]